MCGATFIQRKIGSDSCKNYFVFIIVEPIIFCSAFSSLCVCAFVAIMARVALLHELSALTDCVYGYARICSCLA